MILSGGVGLEPNLREAGLSTQANIFRAFDPKPWDDDVASRRLGELAAPRRRDSTRGARRSDAWEES